MPCPTCSCTVQKLSDEWFWCPRCGTISVPDDDFEMPSLVKRCREFGKSLDDKFLWIGLGVEESIYPPGERSSHRHATGPDEEKQ